MSIKKSSKVMRRIEILLLIISVLIYPIFFLGLGLWGIFWLYSNPDFSRSAFLLPLFSIFLGLVWDSRYFFGGVAFVKPLQNYLHDREDKNDILSARISTINIFIIIYFLVIILIRI